MSDREQRYAHFLLKAFGDEQRRRQEAAGSCTLTAEETILVLQILNTAAGHYPVQTTDAEFEWIDRLRSKLEGHIGTVTTKPGER